MDAFTAVQALYWYCADFHQGQWSPLYKLQCELGYVPGPFERGPDADATEVYAQLASGDLDPFELWAEVQQ